MRLYSMGGSEQVSKLTYERLLDITRAMHEWIFLHSYDEQAVYDELGITEDENCFFGYSGQMEFEVPADEHQTGT